MVFSLPSALPSLSIHPKLTSSLPTHPQSPAHLQMRDSPQVSHILFMDKTRCWTFLYADILQYLSGTKRINSVSCGENRGGHLHHIECSRSQEAAPFSKLFLTGNFPQSRQCWVSPLAPICSVTQFQLSVSFIAEQRTNCVLLPTSIQPPPQVYLPPTS